MIEVRTYICNSGVCNSVCMCVCHYICAWICLGIASATTMVVLYDIPRKYVCVYSYCRYTRTMYSKYDSMIYSMLYLRHYYYVYELNPTYILYILMEYVYNHIYFPLCSSCW